MMPLGAIFIVCLMVAVVKSVSGESTEAWYGVVAVGIMLLIAAIFRAGRARAIIGDSQKHPEGHE